MICCSCNRAEELETKPSLLSRHDSTGPKNQRKRTHKGFEDDRATKLETVTYCQFDPEEEKEKNLDPVDQAKAANQASNDYDSNLLSEPENYAINPKQSDRPREIETALMPFIAELYTDVSHRLSTNFLDCLRPNGEALYPSNAPFIAELLSQADTSSIPEDAGGLEPPTSNEQAPFVAKRSLLPFIAEMQSEDPDAPLVYMGTEERKVKWRAMQMAIRARLAELLTDSDSD
jgi:hypothetical protein